MNTDSTVTSVNGLAFGPGLPEGGLRVSVRMMPGDLCFDANGVQHCAPCEEITATAGGFDHQQMILAWHAADGAWSLTISDPLQREAFMAHAPAVLQPQLARWRKRTRATRHGFRAGWAVLGLLLASPLLALLVFWWQSDRLAGWTAMQVSPEAEQKLGDMLWQQTRPTLKLIEGGESLRVVKDLGARLTRGSEQPFHWHVADSPVVNAFAMPGGYIVVYTGLIKATDTPEELAGVLAHEIEHVTQRHSLKGLIKQVGWRAVVAIALGDIGGGIVGDMTAQLGALKFGRDQETEADLKGLERLRTAGISPEGMVKFFDKLSVQGALQPELLSTHPASAARMETLRGAIRHAGGWKSEPLPYDWPALKATLPSK